MAKGNTPQKTPVLDLNFAAFQYLHHNTPELVLQGGRVVFMFNADDTFYRLAEQYHNNEPVLALDYVNAQRQLKSMMIAMKSNKARVA